MEQHKEEQGHFIKRFFRGTVVFVKWLFVVLLIVLLGAGVYFHAPWKALILIAIFLAAHTVLPKRYRKKFWAVVGCVVFVLAVWVFLPEDNSDWKSYSLVIDEEIAALDAKRAIGDEENAAVIYNQLFADYGKFNDPKPVYDDPNSPLTAFIEKFQIRNIPESGIYPDFWNDELDNMTLSDPWSSKDHPELAEWLDGLKEPFDLLQQASEKEQCVFPIQKPNFFDVTGRHNVFKRWAQMLVRSINNKLGDNDVEGAINRASILIKMAQHQSQQPTEIDILIGIAIEALAYKHLDKIIVKFDLTNRQYQKTEGLLSMIEHDWTSVYLNILWYEQIRNKKLICGAYYEINSKGKIRIARDSLASFRYLYKDIPPEFGLLPDVNPRWAKVSVITEWFWVPSSPKQSEKIFDMVYKSKYAKASPDYDWDNDDEQFSFSKVEFNFGGLLEMLKSITVSAEKKVHELYMRTDSYQQASRLIVGLRRYKNEHGEWPASLEEIRGSVTDKLFVDPVNGGEYGYELTDDGFAIYTKGENGIDEGGVIGREKEDGSKTDDFTFWPGKRR